MVLKALEKSKNMTLTYEPGTSAAWTETHLERVKTLSNLQSHATDKEPL